MKQVFILTFLPNLNPSYSEEMEITKLVRKVKSVTENINWINSINTGCILSCLTVISSNHLFSSHILRIVYINNKIKIHQTFRSFTALSIQNCKSFTLSNCLTDYQNFVSLLPRFFCFLGIQRAQKMDFPGSLNSPSFFKPQITSEVFLHRKYFTIFFWHLQRDSLEITRKRKWLMKNRKIPSCFFFFKSNVLFESEGHEGS